MLPLALVFPGQGFHYAGMGRELYESFPVIKEWMDRAAAAADFDLLHLLFHDQEENLQKTRWQQPALFAMEYALARYLMSLGLHPVAMAGHSLGELTALCLAGVYSLEDGFRIVNKRIRDQGFKAVFFVDDNITYDIDHFRQVCQAIVQHQLDDLCYLTQVSAAGIAQHPELVADMDRANFRITFVGFESMDPNSLKDMKKPTSPATNRRAAALLRQHRIAIIAGLIAGYPEDTRETVIHNYHMIEDLKPDLIYSQYLTPYPKTPVRQELLEAGLVVNADDYKDYDGFHCNIRTRHLSRDELYHLMRGLGFRSNFKISLIVNNQFLRHHMRYFLSSLGQVVAEGLYNLTRDLLPKFLQPRKY